MRQQEVKRVRFFGKVTYNQNHIAEILQHIVCLFCYIGCSARGEWAQDKQMK